MAIEPQSAIYMEIICLFVSFVYRSLWEIFDLAEEIKNFVNFDCSAPLDLSLLTSAQGEVHVFLSRVSLRLMSECWEHHYSPRHFILSRNKKTTSLPLCPVGEESLGNLYLGVERQIVGV